MKLDLRKDHSIALKRHDRKLWSYRDNKPDVVEVAALDYLRDHGFDGYFTERDYYLAYFMLLAGWPGKISKRMPPGFVNPHFVYFNGSDGWLNSHTYSFAQVMAEVENATIDSMTTKLTMYSENCSTLPKNKLEHVLAFLRVLGTERLKAEIMDKFREEELSAYKFLYKFDTEMLGRKYKWASLLSSEGLALGLRPMYIFQCAFWRGGGFENNIEKTEEFAQHINDASVKSEILYACSFAKIWREKTLARHDFATLDLQLWDENGTAIVEVKAPKDRLRQNQKNTIERARSRDDRACVIYVSEAL